MSHHHVFLPPPLSPLSTFSLDGGTKRITLHDLTTPTQSLAFSQQSLPLRRARILRSVGLEPTHEATASSQEALNRSDSRNWMLKRGLPDREDESGYAKRRSPIQRKKGIKEVAASRFVIEKPRRRSTRLAQTTGML
jgi:hypothetical protein